MFFHVTEMPEKPDCVVKVGSPLPEAENVMSIGKLSVTVIGVAVPVKPARLDADRPT